MPVSVLNGILCIQQAESDSFFTLYSLYQAILRISSAFFVKYIVFSLTVTVHSVLSNTLRDAQNLC